MWKKKRVVSANIETLKSIISGGGMMPLSCLRHNKDLQNGNSNAQRLLLC